MNEHGQVVGSAYRNFAWANQKNVAFRWQADVLTPLPPGNLHSTYAVANNNPGQIVGWGELVSQESNNWSLPTNERALLWEGNTLHVLGDLIEPNSGWWLQRANDINNRGEIVGWGTCNGRTRAFLLTLIRVPTQEDFDGDGDVDADDFAFLSGCRTGPAVGPPASGCEAADLDGDGDVDHDDFGRFQRCYAGAGQAPVSGCAD